MRIAALEPSHLVEATRVLTAACQHDRADQVAAEKLFGASPYGLPQAFGAWDGDQLIGVAVIAQQWVRLLAVVPTARYRGVGSALLTTCERFASESGHARLRMLDQPGNYLAPGIDERNSEAIAWLERRGWRRDGEPRCNLLVSARNNPRVTAARTAALANACRAQGYEIRRAAQGEQRLVEAVRQSFGRAWAFEVSSALRNEVANAHVALRSGDYCAFAAYDGNNRGLGWFGPAGTWPQHRGKGLGELLLLSCLLDIAHRQAQCEIAWIGPRSFYEKVCGIEGERTFVAMIKDLPAPHYSRLHSD